MCTLDESAYIRTYGDVGRFEYVVACDEHGRTVGDLRLQRDPDVARYSNLVGPLREAVLTGARIADFGGHIDRPDGRKMEVYRPLWIYLVRVARELGIDVLYAQIRPFLERTFAAMATDGEARGSPGVALYQCRGLIPALPPGMTASP